MSFQLLVSLGLARTQAFQLFSLLGLERVQSFQLLIPLGLGAPQRLLPASRCPGLNDWYWYSDDLGIRACSSQAAAGHFSSVGQQGTQGGRWYTSKDASAGSFSNEYIPSRRAAQGHKKKTTSASVFSLCLYLLAAVSGITPPITTRYVCARRGTAAAGLQAVSFHERHGRCFVCRPMIYRGKKHKQEWRDWFCVGNIVDAAMDDRDPRFLRMSKATAQPSFILKQQRYNTSIVTFVGRSRVTFVCSSRVTFVCRSRITFV